MQTEGLKKHCHLLKRSKRMATRISRYAIVHYIAYVMGCQGFFPYDQQRNRIQRLQPDFAAVGPRDAGQQVVAEQHIWRSLDEVGLQYQDHTQKELRLRWA